MITILNDTHIGVQRSGGTTPQSALELKEYMRDSLTKVLIKTNGSLVVNGDLFDKFEIESSELIATYTIFADWLYTKENTLNLVQGNHDANPRGNKVSSFHMLAHFLKSHFQDQVRVFDKGYEMIGSDVWVIPHCANQDLFEIEVKKACAKPPKSKTKYLLLHCNVKNKFAEHSDHSLNLTDDMVTDLMKAGWTLIVGHEHIGYELRGGRIVVVGNQFPSSVADCIGEKGKHAVRLTEKGVEYIPTWVSDFAELDWRDLSDSDAKFIRVTGDAGAAEAADVISAIAKYRQKSKAYVITNGVKIEGVAAIDELAEASIDAIKAFDVLGAIYEHLDEKERETVKGLLA